MSKGVDLSAITGAIGIATAAVAVVLWAVNDQKRQDDSHAGNIDVELELAEVREEQAQSDIDTREWRISKYKPLVREDACDEGCQARLEVLEKDKEALTRKRDALVREQEILRAKK